MVRRGVWRSSASDEAAGAVVGSAARAGITPESAARSALAARRRTDRARATPGGGDGSGNRVTLRELSVPAEAVHLPGRSVGVDRRWADCPHHAWTALDPPPQTSSELP